ncbi:MAG: hypothetical protein JST54_30580 [Deltaproteobacteria bacterium]|nr:hypothetical protein [Deltaproteobacteria bacterium]
MATWLKVQGMSVEQMLVKLASGMEGSFPSGSTLNVKGQAYKGPAFAAKLKTMLAAYQKVATARVAYNDAVATRDKAEPDAAELARATVTALINFFDGDRVKLAAFGITPPAPRTSGTLEKKLAAKAKRAATRKARGTMGKKQKAEIKATGDFTVSVTATAPAADASPPAPPEAAPIAGPVITAVPAPAPASATNGVTNGSSSPTQVNGVEH